MKHSQITLDAILLLLIFLFLTQGCQKMTSDWKPVEGKLLTRWAKQVTPKNVHLEYPRPQLVRQQWKNLNGLWEYAILPKEAIQPQIYQGKILVPFPVESALSGVAKAVGENNILWYRRVFPVPEEWSGKQILLHFGAVDWETKIWINGKEIGSHRGGYDAFYFDITEALKKSGEQEILVAVWDPIDSGTQPRGKQVKNPHGIWYTSVTGIWQTVWLEPVNPAFIQSIKIVPDIDAQMVAVTPIIAGPDSAFDITLLAKLNGRTIAETKTVCGKTGFLPIKNARLWNPDSPFLYDLVAYLQNGKGEKVDEIKSYFGMRKISLGRDESGITRLMLNNQFVFQFGPLDQGWWPDGLYTAPSDEALRSDIEVTRQLGFNLARKHVKIEPQRWYYWCDKLGLLVWQDMPSGDRFIGGDMPDLQRSAESTRQYEFELKQLVETFGNHPCIVMWVPFNEGWGQFDTPRVVELIKSLDPSRLVDNASGWTDRKVGDVMDIHSYPGPAMPALEEKRAIVLGEFGGLGLPVAGHTWQEEKNWGYRNFADAVELTAAYRELIKNLYPMVTKGLSAAVYTQTTDVEIEVNGLMTYDRGQIKMTAAEVSKINQGYLPPIILSENEILLDSVEVALKNVRQPGEIYYTLDGLEPGKQSALYDKPIMIKESAIIKAQTFWRDGSKSGVSQQTYKKVAWRPSEKVASAQSGIQFSYFENDAAPWDKLPDFSHLTAKEKGVILKINLESRLREDNFGLVFQGLFLAPKDGIYKFFTNSDDGSQLLIGNDLLVDNDLTHGMVEKSGQIALQAGFHPIKITFFQGRGGKGLFVSFKGPGMIKQELQSNVLFH